MNAMKWIVRSLPVLLAVLLIIGFVGTSWGAERPRMKIAVVYDTDVNKTTARFEVDRALELFARQMSMDISIQHEVVDHVADHNNPTALTDAVQRFHYAHYWGDDMTAVTVFLTKRSMFVGSKRLRGFTYVGAAYVSSAATVQLIGDGYDYETIGHELGHTLGATHDDDSSCDPPQFGYIMQTYLSGSDVFSGCSLKQMQTAIDRTPTLFYAPKPAPPPPVLKHGAGSFDHFMIGMLFGVWVAYVLTRRR